MRRNIRTSRACGGRPVIVTGLAVLLAFSVGTAAGVPQEAGTPPKPRVGVFAILRALDEAGTRVWPGFNPITIPLALFDGENTLLRGHPSPPAEFEPVAGHSGLLIARGRHPAVIGNSTRDIGGVRTATVIVDPEASLSRTLLAVVEEVFHGFWMARHQAFRPDEMARYAYPLEDVGNLHALLAEDEALARAIEARSAPGTAAWAAAALALRDARLPSLPDEVRAFETALEMMEGTANCVARVAAGETPGGTVERLRRERPVDGIRWRFYDSGAALCFVLDRLSPGWKSAAEGEPALTMVQQLRGALRENPAEPASFTEAERSALQAKASAAIAAFETRRDQLRAGLFTRAGARIVIGVEAGAAPFLARRFDPVNLMILRAGEVVHPNYLTLESPQGTIEVANPGFARGTFDGVVALSAPAGRHPIRSGIRGLTIVGVSATPGIASETGDVRIEAPGLRVRLRSASVRVEGDVVHVTVRGSRP